MECSIKLCKIKSGWSIVYIEGHSLWFPKQNSKTCLKQPLKNRPKTKLMTNGSLMKGESIAECSLWSILQYFWSALRDNRSWKPSFSCLFEWPLKTGFAVLYFFLWISFLSSKQCRHWWNATLPSLTDIQYVIELRLHIILPFKLHCTQLDRRSPWSEIC